MATFSTIFLFLMVAISSCNTAEILRIERDRTLQHDDIRLPASQCPWNQPRCNLFNSVVLSICWCTCGDIQSQPTSFYEPSFSCVQVSQIRQQVGCQLLFINENSDERLMFFPTAFVREKYVSVPANQRCTFYYGNAFYVQYLDCTGSWRPITQQNVLDTIELTPRNATTSHLKIKIKGTLFQNVTAGRLVRIAIQCRQDTPTVLYTSSCVVFQVHGRIECPYPKPTLSPALTQATLPTPVTDNLNATGTLPPVTTPVKKPTTTPSSEKTTTSEAVDGTTPPSTTEGRKEENATGTLPLVTTPVKKPTTTPPLEQTTTSEIKASFNKSSLFKPTKSQPRMQF